MFREHNWCRRKLVTLCWRNELHKNGYGNAYFHEHHSTLCIKNDKIIVMFIQQSYEFSEFYLTFNMIVYENRNNFFIWYNTLVFV